MSGKIARKAMPYVSKINPFHVETLINLEKYEKIIDYLNECSLYPGKTVVLMDKAAINEQDVKTLPQ